MPTKACARSFSSRAMKCAKSVMRIARASTSRRRALSCRNSENGRRIFTPQTAAFIRRVPRGRGWIFSLQEKPRWDRPSPEVACDLSLLLAILAFFVHVLDRGLVNQQVGLAVAGDLDTALVVPL